MYNLSCNFLLLSIDQSQNCKGRGKNLDHNKSRNWHAENFDWTISTLTTNQFDY